MATGWFPLLSIGSLPSKSYNEGWNAYRQWMTLHGIPLYDTPDGVWTTNYGFLSFHIVGSLGAVLGGPVLAGRIVSFASLLATCWLIGLIVRRAAGSPLGGLYTGLALFAALCSFDSEGRAVDDPEMLSAVFATLGLFAYLRAPGLGWRVLAAAAFCLSLFTKLDYIAFPLAVGLHLAVTRRWRGLLTFLATGVGVAAALLGLSFRIDGPYALADLLQPRAYLLSALPYATLHYLLHLAAPLGIGVFVLCRATDLPERGFLIVLLLASNLVAIAFAGGDGVANNVFYAPIVADLLACGIALCRLQRQGGRAWTAALALCTVGLLATVPSRAYFDAQAMARLPAYTAATRQAVAVLKTTSGPAICEDLLLCYRAGKPLGYDPYYVKDQILIGRLREAGIVAQLDARAYGAIQLRGSANGNWRARMRLRFTPAVQRALLAAYRPAVVNRFYVLLLPDRPP